MKYLIMLIGDETQYNMQTEEDFQASMQPHIEFTEWCENNGVTIHGGEALQDSPTARTVLVNGDVTDGPYFEIKEQLGGYYMIETDSPDLALQAAHKCPNYGANELRPIADMG